MTRTNLHRLEAHGPQRFTLFLDDGGVLNDNALRAPEWRRLIGEYMPLRLGATADEWAAANSAVFPEFWADLVVRMPDFANHAEFQGAYSTGWVRAMCERLALTPPPDDDAETLYRDLSIYIAERASAEIPGAADAVRALHQAGYTLYTASGTTSWELRGIMEKMGIADVFSGLYGPDVADHVKHGPAFYERVFAHADVAPDRALVIDSDDVCCRWTREAGATALWIDPEGRGDATTLEALVRALL